MEPVDEAFHGIVGKTYKDSTPHFPARVAAPAGAPNILCIVLDDVGFGDLGCYGSEISTPAMDRLAAEGLRYSNFHVTSMCSPTRACLLTGRNAHSVGVGIIAEWSSGFPAYKGRITRKAATMAEILGEHGYGAYATGKWHLTNLSDYGAAGPHGDWPLGRGFSRWYGFHGALVDQWNPELCEDNHPLHPIPPAKRNDYHLSTDIVDKSIEHIRDHLTSAPARPFFEYVAFGACHWPHQVPPSFIAKYRGRYDQGWDEVRAARFEKQKSLGIIPKDTVLAPRNPGVLAWDEVPDDAKQLACRLQETYAAFLEHTDSQIERLVDYVRSLGKLDNTLVILMSDNGASAEGGAYGAINMRKHLTYERETLATSMNRLDDIGTERAFNHYPMGWAQVSNTPLKWYKKTTHGGGIRAPLIMRWGDGIEAKGEIRTQFHHVIDLLPTVQDIVGVGTPSVYRGIDQLPMHGISMRYTFDAPNAPTTKSMQHFELIGDRAIWCDGWKAVARHAKGKDFDLDKWELYHLDHDFSEIVDLAATEPERLKVMIAAWWSEAEKFGVLPLDDRETERAFAFLAARPSSIYEYLPHMARIDRLMAPEIAGREFSVVAKLLSTPVDMEGVLFSWGSRFAGLTLYARAGHMVFEYRYSETVKYAVRAPISRPFSQVRVQVERINGAARFTLSIDDVDCGFVDVAKTWGIFGTTAGLTCGHAGVPVSDEFEPPYPFTGVLDRVIVEVRPGEPTQGSDYVTVLREQ